MQSITQRDGVGIAFEQSHFAGQCIEFDGQQFPQCGDDARIATGLLCGHGFVEHEPGRRCCAEVLVEQGTQDIQRDRLDQYLFETGSSEGGPADSSVCTGRQCRGLARRPRCSANPAQGLRPIDKRHARIEKDQFESLRRGQRNRLGAVAAHFALTRARNVAMLNPVREREFHE